MLLTILLGIVAYTAAPKLIKAVAWLGIMAIAILALCAYFGSWIARFIELNPTPTPTPTQLAAPAISDRPWSPAPDSPIGNSLVPNKTPERTPALNEPRALLSPSMESNRDLNVRRERKETPAPSPTETLVKKKAQTPSPQDFDLGDIIATVDWARLTQDRLEVSFRFTNKTQRPLWIIPATRREKGGIQASDDVKNRYQLRSTIGFSRGTDRLHKNILNPNDFLELRPNVPAPASFIFTRPENNTEGATQIYFFATLSVVDDLKTFRSDNRTVSVTIDLE